MCEVTKNHSFDEWAELARSDPSAFEAHRRGVIDAFISSVPPRQRSHLRQVQWRIDVVRKRAPNPLAACRRMYEMMWESFAGDLGLSETLNNPCAVQKRRRMRTAAVVLPFTRGGAPGKARQ